MCQSKHNELYTCLLAAHLFDVVPLKKIPGAKQGVGIVAVALIGYIALMACLKLANTFG